MKTLAYAKWLSIITAVLFFVAGVTSAAEYSIASLLFGFFLAIFFIILVVCIYLTQDRKPFWGILAIVFATIYVVFVSFNYSLQLSFLSRRVNIPEELLMTNPDSVFWLVELLAYFFMGLATLSLCPLFENTLVGKWIKTIFLVNAFLGIGGLVGYAAELNLNIMFAGLIIWNIIMPIASVLLYFYFRAVEKQMTSNI
jgi:hypothetical protein